MSEARSRPGKKAIATRARILDAAAYVFRMNGYVATRLSDVAKVAKTQAGSMYYHFSSREDLVEEVLRVGQERTSGYVRRRVAALPESASQLNRLREAIEAHLATILEIGDYTAATIRILGQVPDEIRKRRLHEQREYGLFWRALVDDAEAADEIRSDLDGSVVRMFLLGAMNSAPDWFRPDQPGLSAEQFERQCVLVFTEGIAVNKVPHDRSLETELTAVERGRAVCAELAATEHLAGSAQRILDAAATIFREKGYAGTRLADVAAAADMQTGSMYYHFSSREDLVVHLLLAAWKRTNDLVRESVNALPAGATPLQRFATAIAAHLLSVVQSGAYTSALMRILGQVPEDVREQAVAHQRAYVDYWRQSFQDAVAAGDIRDDLDPSVTVMMLIGALNWAVEWYRPDGRLNPQDLVNQFATLVFDGLIPGTPER
ncbi:TetR family transcriptional regulator [Streptomyces sp. NPDC051572]|uniref:TetR family transcriptional regulator n=1 Tax=Streptomyces sp. NPDC051572 TaxID=3155802 RepID=UPI00344FBBD4